MITAAKASLPIAAALLLTTVSLGIGGCERSSDSRATSSTAQSEASGAPAVAGYVYITNNGEGTISEFGRSFDGSLDFLRVAKAGAVNGPTGIAIDPSNRFLYVANEGDGRIYEFRIRRDTGDLVEIGEIPLNSGPVSRPQQIAICCSGDFLYVTNFGPGDVRKGRDGSIAEFAIDRANGELKPVDTFRSDNLQQPLGIAVTSSGKFAYATDAGAGTLMSFGVEPSGKLRFLGSIPSLGDRPGHPGLIAIHPSGRFVYTVDSDIGAVVVAQVSSDGTLAGIKSYHVGISTSKPFGLSVVTVGPKVFIYTGNRGSDTVSSLAVRPGGLDLVGECPTGMGFPTGMVADPAGQNLYVVNRDAATVAQFSLKQNHGAALVPTASVFTETPPSQASQPLYIATTNWDAGAATQALRKTRPN